MLKKLAIATLAVLFLALSVDAVLGWQTVAEYFL